VGPMRGRDSISCGVAVSRSIGLEGSCFLPEVVGGDGAATRWPRASVSMRGSGGGKPIRALAVPYGVWSYGRSGRANEGSTLETPPMVLVSWAARFDVERLATLP